jgi:aryl-alcohol dehydrogenase-like predicted oxidoreductase
VPLVTMALQWCLSRWYVTSTIIGATSLEQLKQNCDAFAEDLSPLPEEVLQKIDKVHLTCQNPIMFL